MSYGYTLLADSWPIARKPHRCIWCGQQIEAGEKYRRERSVYNGEMQNHAWHPECDEAAAEEFSHGEQEFIPHQNERPEKKAASGVPVLVAANPARDQGPCTVCGVPWAKHGTAPTCASHDYTPAGVQSSGGWLPIATAPRDGSRILLRWKRRPAMVGWWTDEETGTGWKCDGDVVVPAAAYQADATHWQPMPSDGVAPIDGGRKR